MAIIDPQDLERLWALLTELAEQTNSHRHYTANLHAQANNVKNQAIHSQTGFVLRRFNLDKSQEEYDAELERMNTVMAADNQALLHDNKQLNALIKEYETTLENVMNQFRNRAHEVQEQELSLVREYETRLIARETEEHAQRLAASSAYSESLTRMSRMLRKQLRALGGEDVTEVPAGAQDAYRPEEWNALAAADWALERESELARLEKENALLRRLMGDESLNDDGPANERPVPLTVEEVRQRLVFPTRDKSVKLGGAKGTVGPFATYKRMRALAS
ncbi:hypothetical protein HETIRDRAFT_444926 [Heterobasidion irregulare TC 32-1]|uniref:Uncharacterized protein n=1 Tax=Heterobasidion irregulare (strain TC 32-1) TaxID=747525 RepID=W4K7K2_HETIT|nr:uncharacterized protein HETIRDRAFT_444926 [Heterobasidion irregulare TC 32-1]ETW81787.1 hypothetical protein HETIRDRAFT_444926 [Heterobasidion irregulare TC 32-1]